MMALDRQLLGHHKVWQEDLEEAQVASAIVGLVPTPKKQAKPIEQPHSDVSDKDPYATPKARTIADGPPGGLYLPHLRKTNFLLFLAVLLVSGGLFYAGWQIKDPDTKPIIYSLAGMGLLFWLALCVIYVYRAWEMMPMFGAVLNGSKAARFLLIPFFNALWCFVVLFGWSKLWNRSVTSHPGLSLASKVWRPFFFLFSILFLISQTLMIMYLFIKELPTDLNNPLHQIALGTWAITLLIGLVCWFQMSRSINFLARKKS